MDDDVFVQIALLGELVTAAHDVAFKGFVSCVGAHVIKQIVPLFEDLVAFKAVIVVVKLTDQSSAPALPVLSEESNMQEVTQLRNRSVLFKHFQIHFLAALDVDLRGLRQTKPTQDGSLEYLHRASRVKILSLDEDPLSSATFL